MKSQRTLLVITVSVLGALSLACSSSASKRPDNSMGGDSGEGGSSGASGSGGEGGTGPAGSGGGGGTSGAGGAGTGGTGAVGGDLGGSGGEADAAVMDAESSGGAGGSPDAGGGGAGGGGTGGGRDVLLLAGGKGAIDASLMTGLKAKGFTVVMAADNAPAAMAAGKALVVISSTTSRGNIDPKFKDATVPIIVMKDGVMKALGMTGADVVTGTGLSKISMVMGAEPALTAGKTGDVTVYSNTDRMFAGEMLGADAKKVATLVGQAAQWAIFAYDKGGMMTGGPAAAKRVGFFAHQDGSLSPDGLALFEAAVDWCTK
jgi:hypothetical protein